MRSLVSEVRDLIERHRGEGIAPVEEVTDVVVLYRALQEPLGEGELREMNGSARSGMSTDRFYELLDWARKSQERESVCCCGEPRGHGGEYA